jgi:hypothetical protein
MAHRSNCCDIQQALQRAVLVHHMPTHNRITTCQPVLQQQPAAQ